MSCATIEGRDLRAPFETRTFARGEIRGDDDQPLSHDTCAGIENINSSNYDDGLYGDDGDNVINGNDDKLFGNGGNDTINGGNTSSVSVCGPLKVWFPGGIGPEEF